MVSLKILVIGVFAAAVCVGIAGCVIALLLGLAGEKLKVKEDERVGKVRDSLPGANCGGCGYPGCDALASAIVEGAAPVSACPVGGAEVTKKVAAIMGVEAEESAPKCAFVRCAGTCQHAKDLFEYVGPQGCTMAQNVPNNGPKGCTFGCLGMGDCVKVCQFGALSIVDGIAHVDPNKCVACGKCAEACPRGVIAILPADASPVVRCNSKEKGPEVKKVCDVGCIGCGLCKRNCPQEAIEVTDNLAVIDPEKCIHCGACIEKCPVKAIH